MTSSESGSDKQSTAGNGEGGASVEHQAVPGLAQPFRYAGGRESNAAAEAAEAYDVAAWADGEGV